MASPGSPTSPGRDLWIYDQLLRVERHWTEQIQRQQTRLATTLSVNGIMLAFIAGGGFLNYVNLSLPAKIFLFLSVLVLATGIVFGLLTMRSKVAIGGDAPGYQEDGVAYFLSSRWLSVEGRDLDEKDLLHNLSESLASKPGATMPIVELVGHRRAWLARQQLLIGVAACLLVIFVPLAVF